MQPLTGMLLLKDIWDNLPSAKGKLQTSIHNMILKDPPAYVYLCKEKFRKDATVTTVITSEERG